jgi:hypothetical protein
MRSNPTLDGLLRNGGNCPTCNQHVEQYRRSIAKWSVYIMFRLNRFAGPGEPYVKLGDIMDNKVTGDFAITRHWGLTEMMADGKQIEDNGTKGMWRMTQAGQEWISGLTKVSRYGWFYNNELLRFEGIKIDVWTALKQRFNNPAIRQKLVSGEFNIEEYRGRR